MDTGDKFLVVVVGTSIVAVLVVLGFAIASAVESKALKKRLMAECLADGHREYACYGTVYGGGSSTPVPMPVIVPVR